MFVWNTISFIILDFNFLVQRYDSRTLNSPFKLEKIMPSNPFCDLPERCRDKCYCHAATNPYNPWCKQPSVCLEAKTCICYYPNPFCKQPWICLVPPANGQCSCHTLKCELCSEIKGPDHICLKCKICSEIKVPNHICPNYLQMNPFKPNYY